jgi:hypothetical protein
MATRQQSKQQVSRADELVITIGNLLLGDENVAGQDWDAVSLVINLDGRRSLFGYLYDAGGNADPLVLEESDLLDYVEELRELMAADGEPWKAVMVQFVEGELRFTFDADGTAWSLDGDNTGAMVDALRPELPAPAKKKPAAKKKPSKKAAPKKTVSKKKTAPKAKVAKKKR